MSTQGGARRKAGPMRRTRRRSGGWMKLKPGGGDRLRRKRIRLRWTQRDLAYMVRCSQNTISLLEQEKMTTLSEELAELIVQRFDDAGIDAEDIFEKRESAGMRRMATGARTNRQTVDRGAA
jgi:putative transcriptional regulator